MVVPGSQTSQVVGYQETGFNGAVLQGLSESFTTKEIMLQGPQATKKIVHRGLPASQEQRMLCNRGCMHPSNQHIIIGCQEASSWATQHNRFLYFRYPITSNDVLPSGGLKIHSIEHALRIVFPEQTLWLQWASVICIENSAFTQGLRSLIAEQRIE